MLKLFRYKNEPIKVVESYDDVIRYVSYMSNVSKRRIKAIKINDNCYSIMLANIFGRYYCSVATINFNP